MRDRDLGDSTEWGAFAWKPVKGPCWIAGRKDRTWTRHDGKTGLRGVRHRSSLEKLGRSQLPCAQQRPTGELSKGMVRHRDLHAGSP